MIHILENLHRVGGGTAIELVKEEFASLKTGLSVNIESVGLDERGWVHADFSGPDAEVLTEIVARTYGIASKDLNSLQKGDLTRGVIVDSTVGYGVYVDICLRSSKKTDALYPLHVMRSQLVEGNKLSVREISKRFSLHGGFPLKTRVTNVDSIAQKVDIELSDEQAAYFKNWERFPFDRVVLIGCSKTILKNAVESANLRRDIADIESLGLAVHVLTCKLGTDAPGIIPRIGRFLRGVNAYAFQPRTP